MIAKKFLLLTILLLADIENIFYFIRNNQAGSALFRFDTNTLNSVVDNLFKQQDVQLLKTTNNKYHCKVVLLAEAKGVAGLGKAGGEGSGGSDKAGQQVPPEVYIALTYAGTAFLLTLSVPLILYGLNKLYNRIEDCFGCGPSSKKKALLERSLQNQHLNLTEEAQKQAKKNHSQISIISANNISNNQFQQQPSFTTLSTGLNQKPSMIATIEAKANATTASPSLNSLGAKSPCLDTELNYKTTATPLEHHYHQHHHQHQLQQPQSYIISSPYL